MRQVTGLKGLSLRNSHAEFRGVAEADREIDIPCFSLNFSLTSYAKVEKPPKIIEHSLKNSGPPRISLNFSLLGREGFARDCKHRHYLVLFKVDDLKA